MKNKATKTLITLLLAAGAAAALASCGSDSGDLKVGIIYVGDPSTSTYDKNFKNAIDAAAANVKAETGKTITVLEKPSTSDQTNAAYTASTDLVNSGCKLVIADSFGHESHVLDAAKENSDVQFCHASGDLAHTAGVSNFHNAFASIYEGRYLAGIVAGMKLNEIGGAHKLGYVGAYPYAEVISGYTAYYLGAKSVCSDVTMDVRYTNSWGDEALEKEAANQLIADGAQIISQHADSYGAPAACKEKGVYNISYNVAAQEGYEDTYLAYSRIDWTAYFEYTMKAVINGTSIDTDYTGTLAKEGVVAADILGKNVASGTAEKVAEAKAALVNGTKHVFDVSTFTVTNKAANPYADITVDAQGHLTSAKADVDYDEGYTKDHEAVSDGYYHESEMRSAPYFDLIIDGITTK